MINKESNNFPIITVLTLTYKKFDKIIETICSVLNQEYEAIEYIISDDGSDNFPYTMIKSYIENHKRGNIINYKIIQNKENRGTVANQNNAVKEIMGKYITHLAGDDVFYDTKVLRSIVNVMENENARMLVTSRLVCDNNLIPLYYLPHKMAIRKIKSLKTSRDQYEAYVSGMYYNMASGSVFCIDYDVLKELNFYDSRYRLWDDGPFLSKYLWNYKLIFNYDIISIKYREGGVSDVKNIHPALKQDEKLYKMTDRIIHFDELSNKCKKMILMSNEYNSSSKHAHLKTFLRYPISYCRKVIYSLTEIINLEIDKRLVLKKYYNK